MKIYKIILANIMSLIKINQIPMRTIILKMKKIKKLIKIIKNNNNKMNLMK